MKILFKYILRLDLIEPFAQFTLIKKNVIMNETEK